MDGGPRGGSVFDGVRMAGRCRWYGRGICGDGSGVGECGGGQWSEV